MSKIAMAVDLDMCTGCFACQNACKMVNDLPPGVQWLRVLPVNPQPEEVNGQLYMDRFPVPASLTACLSCPDRTQSASEGESRQPLCARSCMGIALRVGSVEDVETWAQGKRSVLFRH